MLSPYRVLDLCDERGHLAGRILAELGAEVVKVEPPQGDPLRHVGPYLGGVAGPERALRWLAGNASKRGVTIDLHDTVGRDRLLALADDADVLLESFAPGTLDGLGLGWDVLHARNPRLVHCAITPFGQEGPYAGYRASDLSVVAMGGNASMTGDPDGPPTRCSRPTSIHHAAPTAALGVAMALYQRERTGRGQQVDVSMHECQLGTLLSGAAQYPLTRRLGRRAGGFMGRTREIWPARDGQISFGLRGGPARIPNLVATVAWMHEEGMASDWLRAFDWEQYSPITVGQEDLERLQEALAAFFVTKTMAELYEQALARRILLAPCNDARSILAQEQLRSRDFFVAVPGPEEGDAIELPAFFAKASRSRIGVRSRAPRLGEHDDHPFAGERAPRDDVSPGAPRANVFAGLRVLELGAGAAGPVATGYFAEHGAHVVRIESAARPDFLRMLHLTAENRNEPGILEKAPMFVLLNPNKDSLALNMKEPRAVEIVKQLARWADVVAENFAPGVMDKWGLDAKTLLRENPRLVVVSGCLFGQTGPQKSYPGFGGQGSAIAGYNHLTGRPDGDAHGPYATITDSLAPRYVATAIVAALLERNRSGQGQAIDVSQIETGVYSLSDIVARYSANGEVETRRGNRDEHAAPHGIFPCRGDDRWIAIACHTDADWAGLVDAMGCPDWVRPEHETLAGRQADEDEIEAGITRFTRDHDPQELMQQLQARGLEACAVQDFSDLHEDPQLAARGHWVEVPHRHLGPLRFERSGFRLSDSPGGITRPGPLLGEHNRPLLEGLLGLSSEAVDELVEAGVVG